MGNKMNNNFFSMVILSAATFMLAACAGNAPCPATDASVQQAGMPAAPAESSAAPGQAAPAQQATAQDAKMQPATATKKSTAEPSATNEGRTYFTSDVLDSYRLSTPDSVPAANGGDGSVGINNVVCENPAATAAAAPDPYTDFPALAARVFAHADSLYATGLTDSASAYLQRFRIIKPLWNTWEAQADSMLNEFGKTRAEKAKAFEPLVLTIQNMNRVKSAYSMVAEIADSLIALAPGDSLVNWAKVQKQNAFANTLEKAKKEFAQIKALADDQAQFAEALKKIEEFRMRYGDFEQTLRIQEYTDHVKEMMQSADSEAAEYWESHDPAQALAKADTLIKASKFAEAKDILTKLKASNLRKKAGEKYQELANTFCNAQRKTTSQIFAKAQKQKDAAKKKKLLQDAIGPLDKCLAEYPEYTQKQKVVDNKSFLEKELAK